MQSKKQLNVHFRTSAADGNLDEVKAYLSQGADIDEIGNRLYYYAVSAPLLSPPAHALLDCLLACLRTDTSLCFLCVHLAMRTNETGTSFCFAVAAAADDDARFLGQATALQLAAFYGRTSIVTFLLQSGATASRVSEKGKTALEAAEHIGNWMAADLIRNKGETADIIRNFLQQQAAEAARRVQLDREAAEASRKAQLDREQEVKVLQKKNKNLEKENAAFERDIQRLQGEVQVLQENNMSLEKEKATFMREIQRLQAAVQVLEEKNQSQEEESNDLQVIQNASAEIITFTIDVCKAKVDNCDENGFTVLMLASRHGLKDVVSVLSERTDVNTTTNSGFTALMETASNNRLEAAQVLVLSGADVNTTTNDKANALMFASINGNTKLVRYLIDQDAAIDACNKAGETALMLAIQHGHLPTMQLLLEKGAAVSIQNAQGCTALMLSSKENCMEAAAVLLMFNPDRQLEVRDNNGDTALMIASKHGYQELVSLLLRNGANCWTVNFQGFTAKFLANRFGHAAIEDLLHTWEKNNPKPEQKNEESDMSLTIEHFLETINLAHLTGFFVDNMGMETVGEFGHLNQRRWGKVKSQLSAIDLNLLVASLQEMGIFIPVFLSSTLGKPDTNSSAQAKTSKGSVNDVPS